MRQFQNLRERVRENFFVWLLLREFEIPIAKIVPHEILNFAGSLCERVFFERSIYLVNQSIQFRKNPTIRETAGSWIFRNFKLLAKRAEIDSRTESLNKKIREAQIQQIPLIITIGEKEKTADTLSVRTLDGTVRYGVSHDAFLEAATRHVKERKIDLELW